MAELTLDYRPSAREIQRNLARKNVEDTTIVNVFGLKDRDITKAKLKTLVDTVLKTAFQNGSPIKIRSGDTLIDLAKLLGFKYSFPKATKTIDPNNIYVGDVVLKKTGDVVYLTRGKEELKIGTTNATATAPTTTAPTTAPTTAKPTPAPSTTVQSYRVTLSGSFVQLSKTVTTNEYSITIQGTQYFLVNRNNGWSMKDSTTPQPNSPLASVLEQLNSKTK